MSNIGKGFALITFSTMGEAVAAMAALDGQEVCGGLVTIFRTWTAGVEGMSRGRAAGGRVKENEGQKKEAGQMEITPRSEAVKRSRSVMELPFPCLDCKQGSYPTNKGLQQHRKYYCQGVKQPRTEVVTKNLAFPCTDTDCNLKSHEKAAGLKQHSQQYCTVSSRDKGFTCTDCNLRSFETKAGLKMHKDQYCNKLSRVKARSGTQPRQELPFPCPDCNLHSYSTEAGLLQHRARYCIQPSIAKNDAFPCTDCNMKSFKTTAGLKQHSLQYCTKSSRGKEFTCPDCNKFYASVAKLNEHRREYCLVSSINKGQLAFTCTDCNLRSFETKAGLKTHRYQHCTKLSRVVARSGTQPREELPFPCPDCNLKSFTTGADLLNHRNGFCFPCGDCDQAFGSKLGLRQHKSSCSRSKSTQDIQGHVEVNSALTEDNDVTKEGSSYINGDVTQSSAEDRVILKVSYISPQGQHSKVGYRLARTSTLQRVVFKVSGLGIFRYLGY